MAVNLRQTHFRFGIDELAESTHGWFAAEDTNVTIIPAGKKFLLRITEQESGGTAINNVDAQLQYNKNGAGWNNVTTTSSVVKAVAVQPFADGANCTKRLSGTGTFESSGAGCSEDGTSGGSANDIVASGNSETEFGLQVVSGDVAEGDVIQFRITSGVTTVSYDVTPQLTVPRFKLIQGPVYHYAISPNTTSFANTPTEGNLLICRARSNNPASGGSITGWTLALGEYTSGGVYQGLWYKVAGASESKDVVLTWGTGAGITMMIEEWGGFAGTPTLDKTASSTGGSSENSHSSGTTATITADVELCFGCFELSSTSDGAAYTNSFTEEYSAGGTTHLATLITSSASTISTTMSWTTSRNCSGMMITFKEAAIGLVIQEDSQSQVSDSPALNQVHALVPQEEAQAQGVDTPALTQIHSIVVAEEVQSQVVDNVVIEEVSGAVNLVAQEATQAQAIDVPALSQVHALAVQGGAQVQVIEGSALTQEHVLFAAENAQIQVADSPELTQVHALATQEAGQAQAAEEPALVQIHELMVQENNQVQAVKVPALTQEHDLAAAEVTQGQLSDSPALTQTHALSTQEDTQAQKSDEAMLEVLAEVNLVPDEASQGQKVYGAALTQIQQLLADLAAQNQTVDPAILAQAHQLIATDSWQAQQVDKPVLIWDAGRVVLGPSGQRGTRRTLSNPLRRFPGGGRKRIFAIEPGERA